VNEEDAPLVRPSALDHPLPPEVERAKRVDRAMAIAVRYLDHRERTVAEVRGKLREKEVEPDVAEEVLGELLELGTLDDARFARIFAEDRRLLDGWGAGRIERRLLELGVDREHVAAALAGDAEHDELGAAVALLRRRFPAPPETPREQQRALGHLVRKGYATELAYDALRAYADGRRTA
jgi:regulatory protein